MSEGRNKLKKHIRAAKEWLGAAEKSLDRQEDVKGDLNVMLAKAELQHASEMTSEAGAVFWAKKIIPLLIAVSLVYGTVIFYDKPAKENHVEKSLPIIVEKHVSQGKESVEEVTPAADKKQETMTDTVVPKSVVSVEENVQEEKSKIPAEEMQKLMCTAGQHLRAQ